MRFLEHEVPSPQQRHHYAHGRPEPRQFRFLASRFVHGPAFNSERNMHRQTRNINALSPADIVQAINTLAERGRQGENVNEAVAHALDMLDRTHCRTVSDATALLSIVHLLLQDLGSQEAGAERFRFQLVDTAIRHQMAALTFLTEMDLHLQAEEARGGATIN